MKNFLKEFKEFAMRGNVMDLAVGVVIGGAFGKIVSSLVSDVIMPIIGVILGGVNFTDIKITLKHATVSSLAVTLNIGNFLQAIVDFTIVALAIFVTIKLINRLKREKRNTETIDSVTKEQQLLIEIRDLLKK